MFQLQIGRREVRFGGSLLVPVAGDQGDGFIEFIFRMLPLLLADDFFRAHSVRPAQIGSRALLLGLPVFHLRLCRGDARPARINGRAQRAVVQQRQKLPGPHMVTDLHRNIHHAAIALRSNIGLLIGNQRSGSGERFCVRRSRRRSGGRSSCRSRRRSLRGAGVLRMRVAAGTNQHNCDSSQRGGEQ